MRKGSITKARIVSAIAIAMKSVLTCSQTTANVDGS